MSSADESSAGLDEEREHRVLLYLSHTAPQRCQPDRSGTLDFLLDSCYCDLDMTISVAKKML